MPGAEEEGWVVMASNFKISAHRNSENLYLYVLKDRPIRLVFTGENATEIAPERNKFF